MYFDCWLGDRKGICPIYKPVPLNPQGFTLGTDEGSKVRGARQAVLALPAAIT